MQKTERQEMAKTPWNAAALLFSSGLAGAGAGVLAFAALAGGELRVWVRPARC